MSNLNTLVSSNEFPYLDTFREAKIVRSLLKDIESLVSHPIAIMEVCGGQTHSFLRYGILPLLPKNLTIIHGPGCPVCVTPLSFIDQAIQCALAKDTVLCTYADMLRVPGSQLSLLEAKALGGNVQEHTSPLSVLELAKANPAQRYVFFAIGFETTAPAHALAVLRAKEQNIKNFQIICAHVLVPPILKLLLQTQSHSIQGFLAPGHVCSVIGEKPFLDLAQEYAVSFVVTGFEPVDLLYGLRTCLQLASNGASSVRNAYGRFGTKLGNPLAREVLSTVFEVVDCQWRGFGWVPSSGLQLKKAFAQWDARSCSANAATSKQVQELCMAGEVLKGKLKPPNCPYFAKSCTPSTPLGAPMVSSEGACAAYYAYGLGEVDN